MCSALGEIASLAIAALAVGGVQDKALSEREQLNRQIRALETKAGNRNKDETLLVWVLLLQRRDFARVKKAYEAEPPDIRDFHLNMAYLQALLGLEEYDAAIGKVAEMSDALDSKFKPLNARRSYYRGIRLRERGEKDAAYSEFAGAVEEDPTFELPYQRLALYGTTQNAIIWSAKGLSLVQPATDFAKRTRAHLLELLEKAEQKQRDK